MLPLTTTQRNALEALKGQSSVIREALVGSPSFLQDLKWEDKCIDSRPLERASLLVEELKKFLVDMSNELDELPDDKERIQSEAVGIVIALREIYSHFPELREDV